MKVLGRSTRRKEREQAAITGEAFYFIAGQHTSEDALIVDVAQQGAGVLISRPLETGQMVKLKFAMPRQLRSYDYSVRNYEVWGVVRYATKDHRHDSSDRYEIGIAFMGKDAPPEYLAAPETLFDIRPVPKRDGLWAVRLLPRVSDRHL
jgi:hypothetical protein